MKSAKDIRQAFMSFFKDRGHTMVHSAPVVVHGDPTLMFTNAGMNQFKDVFLGTGSREYPRAVNTQKCIRVSGKHNDLEEVGVDTYHHTFFEMLGNWSFGDYFKRDAIKWGWDFLVNEMALPADKLWATVFSGEEALGLPPDTEAESLWPQETSIPKERVLRFGSKDNFWEMAETGPCGPCSEIHMDLGPEACDMQNVAGHECGVNGDCGRYIEIWNLVFIQFNRLGKKSLKPLPAFHVDTGMGFERLVAVCQKKSSNYDTDLFTPLLDKIGDITSSKYGASKETDIAMRVIADHARALTVAIADGAVPGNKDRGYVLRRILRRATRFGYQILGHQTPFIHEIAPTVAQNLGEAFPEIHKRLDHIRRIIKTEEESFLVTLDRGISRFNSLAGELEDRKDKVIDGAAAYDLYSTYGFPKDLIELMARERNLKVDEEAWNKAEGEHKLASTGTKEEHLDAGELEGIEATRFLGYWDDPESNRLGTSAEAKILRIINNEYLVLDRTPFYAEAGGQIGDTGVITGPGFEFRVTDTFRHGDIWLHKGYIEKMNHKKPPTQVTARVDKARRLDIMANHTCTHILHWALHNFIAQNADQQGSLVHPEYFRFDFTHDKGLTRDQLDNIERAVNDKITQDLQVSITEESYKDAIESGVTALFGEKYEDRVRVVRVGEMSQELCGGTHCLRTGQIGYFRIVSERAVSAGIRRITAETRGCAVASGIKQRRLLEDAARSLNTSPEDLNDRIMQLQEQIKSLKKGKDEKKVVDIKLERKRLLKEADSINGAAVIVKRLDNMDPKTAGDLADALRGGEETTAGLLATVSGKKVVFVAFASKDLVKSKKVSAGKLVQAAAQAAGGSGGGRPDFAKGGSKDVGKLDESLRAAVDLLKKSMGF